MYFFPLFCSSIVIIDEHVRTKKSSMPHKKKKIIDEIRSMILYLLNLWGVCDRMYDRLYVYYNDTRIDEQKIKAVFPSDSCILSCVP